MIEPQGRQREESGRSNPEKHKKQNIKDCRAYRARKKIDDPEWWQKEMKRLRNLPSVIRWQKLRFNTLKRDNFTCQYCGRKAPEVKLHIDHKIPKSKGGLDELNNLITACEDCNLGKGDSLSSQGNKLPQKV